MIDTKQNQDTKKRFDANREENGSLVFTDHFNSIFFSSVNSFPPFILKDEYIRYNFYVFVLIFIFSCC